MSANKKQIFPKDFLWGASTASHQVEGGNHNDWTVWELANANQLAKTAHQRISWTPSWTEIKKQAEDPNNYVSGKGVEHYKRYKEDFNLIEQLGLNAFRFGIEWARLEPQEGEWDEAEVEHYREYIKELKQRGIEPLLNIWHWTNPVWFAKKGGFTKRANLRYFERFVQKIAQEFCSELKYVITINEPNVYSAQSYLTGEWPPQNKNVWKFAKVYWYLSLAHKRAYKLLKAKNTRLQIGVATQLANIQAKRPHNLLDEVSTKWMRYFWNWWWLRRIRNHQDFIGFNYYFTDYYQALKRVNPKLPLNDLGWYMEPEGLYPLLLRIWAHYHKPIIITENGLADMHDEHRQWWIQETIIAMERALSEGVQLHGYFHWSLLDNFEWAYGWWPKFGLVAVDREHNMKRTIRPSALWWAEKIERLKG